MLVGVPDPPLPIQLPPNSPEKVVEDGFPLMWETQIKLRAPVGQPSSSHYSHLGCESVEGRSLHVCWSVSLILPLKQINKERERGRERDREGGRERERKKVNLSSNSASICVISLDSGFSVVKLRHNAAYSCKGIPYLF